eukprot:12177199-Alexandrium_andersonii.AAC.1
MFSGHVKEGCALYIPAGYVVLEKCLNGCANFGIRTSFMPSMLKDISREFQSLVALRDHFGEMANIDNKSANLQPFLGELLEFIQIDV